MKILCLSDLHLMVNPVLNLDKRDIYNDMVSRYNPDIIVISGDVIEYRNTFSDPYKLLSEFFDVDIPIICCLGNHEFFNRTVKDTIDYYTSYYNPSQYNIHYLDIVSKFESNNINFIGNVLWYDGSLKSYSTQCLYDWADGRWADRLIKKFDWKLENKKCVDQIERYVNPNMDNFLCTHSVPFKKLNAWPDSDFNAYSGVDDLSVIFNKSNLFKHIKYIACGHTHRRQLVEINDAICINVGNDYYEPYQYYLLEA